MCFAAIITLTLKRAHARSLFVDSMFLWISECSLLQLILFELYKSYSRYKLVPVDVDRVHTFWGQDHLRVGLEILSNAKLDDMRMEQQSQKFVADGKKWVQRNFIIFNQNLLVTRFIIAKNCKQNEKKNKFQN